jgi:hypothetical protein
MRDREPPPPQKQQRRSLSSLDELRPIADIEAQVHEGDASAGGGISVLTPVAGGDGGGDESAAFPSPIDVFLRNVQRVRSLNPFRDAGRARKAESPPTPTASSSSSSTTP